MWNEQDHPRDDDGKFTFKNAGSGATTTYGAANVLYKDSKIKAQKDKQEAEYKSKLLNILGDKVKPTNVLYGTTKELEEKIKGYELQSKLKGAITGGAASTNNNQNFTRPVEGNVISEFGPRKVSLKDASKDHKGIDIKVPVGTPVKAIADGTVIAARSGMKGYGVGVFVDHGIINGKHVISEYGHLSKFDVKVGDKIKKGQTIAKSGNTGTSEGPHLHVTIRENKIQVDPRKNLNYTQRSLRRPESKGISRR